MSIESPKQLGTIKSQAEYISANLGFEGMPNFIERGLQTGYYKQIESQATDFINDPINGVSFGF